MKNNLILVLLLLVGCRSPLPPSRPLPDPQPIHGSPASLAKAADNPVAPTNATSTANRSQSSARLSTDPLIEALTAQNDALAAQLHALEVTKPAPTSAASPPSSASTSLTPAPAPTTPPLSPPRTPSTLGLEIPLLTPNSDGVIDTTANRTSNGPANPFAVRAASAEGLRELTFNVQGIVAGSTPCAIVNGRVVALSEMVESLKLVQLDTDAVVLGSDTFNASVPLGVTKLRLGL